MLEFFSLKVCLCPKGTVRRFSKIWSQLSNGLIVWKSLHNVPLKRLVVQYLNISGHYNNAHPSAQHDLHLYLLKFSLWFHNKKDIRKVLDLLLPIFGTHTCIHCKLTVSIFLVSIPLPTIIYWCLSKHNPIV